VRRLRWTRRAREDLASIRAFITEESPNYAALVVGRIVAATDRLAQRHSSRLEIFRTVTAAQWCGTHGETPGKSRLTAAASVPERARRPTSRYG
jgi:hypothetical protein